MVYAPGWESFILGVPSHIPFAILKGRDDDDSWKEHMNQYYGTGWKIGKGNRPKTRQIQKQDLDIEV